MAITNLTNTKWVLNVANEITTPASPGETYSINFISADYDDVSQKTNYSEFKITKSDGKRQIFYSSYQVLYGASWIDESFRIIEITGGTDVTNATLIAWLEANATQINVTDLTGTKWVINESPIVDGDADYSINFTSNNSTWSLFEFSTGNDPVIKYDWQTTMYNGDSGTWTSQAYRLISITGGNDVSNPDLLVWLSQNATLVPVVDLSGTTWDLNDIVNIDTDAEYYINFTSKTYSYTGIHIEENHDVMSYYIDYPVELSVYEQGLWEDDGYRTISITNGTDVANPDLIAWLTDNATYREAVPVKTFDLSTLDLSAGTHEIKVKARASGYRDSNFSNSVTYNAPQKYSGNIEEYSSTGYADTKIKFDTPPQSEDDYDSATWSGFSDIYGLTSYQNKNKIYIWSGLNAKSGGKVKINNIETNGGTTYDTAVELDLTGNYTIYLFRGNIA